MDVLKKSIRNPQEALTIADAATLSGLSFEQTERGLLALVAEYRGELIPTEKGELLFRFPTGFSKPWERVEAFETAWRQVKKVALGIAKFVVRAWITVVMVAYVAIFAAILIALSFAQKSDRDDRGSSFGHFVMLDVLLRVILDALFWTFHPFSPFYVGRGVPRRRDAGMPFYEKVNCFFFGPEEVPIDPLENKKRVLEEIRLQKGRIGMLDVLRVTGMTREQVDPFISALMLEYNGDVKVSEFGGITYSFPGLLRSARNDDMHSLNKQPTWLKRKILGPLTGNPAGSNVMIAGLNAFNLFMSLVAIENNWTLESLKLILSGIPPHLMPDTGAPLLLGWVPFWFSAVLFALPVMRWLARPRKQQKVNRDNGRRGMLWAVLNRLSKRGISESVLEEAWEKLATTKPSEREIAREVVKLGGELDLDLQTGYTNYRFKNLELEVQALEKERAQAQSSERDVGTQIEF